MLPNGSVTASSAPYGVDFGAVLSFAEALGGPTDLVAELLPGIEAIIVRSSRSDAEA